MRRFLFVGVHALTASLVLAGEPGEAPRERTAEPVIGGCDGCELAFKSMPGQPETHSRIVPEGEEGQPLLIDGVVRTAEGKPVSGVIIYAHQTNSRGIYPGLGRHGNLRGWARSDSEGRYSFRTIRPGAYPRRAIPQHVHLQVIEPGRAVYYIDDIVFEDDPLLTPAQRAGLENRGGNGIVNPRREGDGVWRVTRDIVLGANVPGYERLSPRAR